MSRRTEQVAEEIRRILGDLLLREMRDPRIGMLTVTGVEVSSDLKHARVHVSVLGSEEDERLSMGALRKASGFLRTELGRRLTLRYVPELRFEPDRSAQHAVRISQLLDQLSPSEADEGEPEHRPGQ
jgi:ribosome-binding factor A